MLLQVNSNYFSKMALVRFQYEPLSLDVNKVCLEGEHNIPYMWEKPKKVKV